ncbi:Chromosome partition protein Smc [Oligella sp. MSHR50489EDL]|uniref:chromosome segregation protein SMC n=1 Tax=Oligella sp. MSHR50489EDL TaxID=3139409 RepID=UPI003D817BA0
MRLTQIKLAGFKSFVDPTTIPVPSQLVGIVGPNGCGKSNIIDSVRWVLGETRASELRGESMQDVIFNGSDERRPAGRASVELVFDNSEGRAVGQWSVFAEISVRRILTRDGTSSYYINNQQVRRRDIHDVFLGTGLGARGYAIIGQGMINRLIEAKPEELRTYLEEAAGVSRYKERRRETENRLADTRENLTRVEDILGELANQLRRLEAQAEVATRYRSLQAEGEQKQFAFWFLKEQSAIKEQAAKKAQREKAQSDLEEALASFRQIERELEYRRQAHYQAGDALHKAQTALYESNAQVTSLEAEIRHASESCQRLQSNKSRLQQQIEEWDAQFEHCAMQLEEVDRQLEEAIIHYEESQARLEQIQQELPEIEEKAAQFDRDREQLRLELSRLEQKQALLQQQKADTERQLSQLSSRRERLQQEQSAVVAPEIGKLETLKAERDNSEHQLEEAQAQLLEIEERLPLYDEERREAAQDAQKAQQVISKLEARLEALQSLQADVMQNKELEPWLKTHGLSEIFPLWQKIQIEPGWDVALESVLGERLGALEISSLEAALTLAEDNPPTRMVVYQKPGPLPVNELNHALKPLLSLMRCPDPDLKGLLGLWLDGVFVADTVAEALAKREQLPQGARFVVKQGHLVDRFGLCFYAAESEQAGMLARQQEIENLQREIKAERLITEQLSTALQQAERQWQTTNQALVPARQRVSEMSRFLHEYQLAYSQLVQKIEQADILQKRLNTDLEELELQQEEFAGRIEAFLLDLESNQELLEQKREAYAELNLQSEASVAAMREIRQRSQEIERATREIEFEQRSLKSRAEELKRNQTLSKQQSEQSKAELESLEGELFDIDQQSTQAALQELLEARKEREEALAAKRMELEEIELRLREQDEKRLQLELSIEPCRQEITQLQLDEQAARLAAEQFTEQLDRNEVERPTVQQFIEDNPQVAKIAAVEEQAEWLQAETQRISRAIDRLGSVNLAALEELEQAQQRKTFLDAQQADLQEAIDTLEEAIRNIDRETRQLLQETFELVNSHFGELFPRLFGGGQAKLVMTGEEILDAGVQVMAQPPGKRNSTIHLLSGGEKALTATALVFALFKLNPAPFCLLDEVDAPLDDANTERYANLVSSMSDQTQFLFISHNKIAMQIAKQLVGVTMQEQGVSRIVAVDLDAAVQMMGAD